MKFSFSRRTKLIVMIGLPVILVACAALYLSAQTLVTRVIQTQLRQAGYTQAVVEHTRLYFDGIVIGHIRLTPQIELHEIFTPQSPPDIAKRGLQHLIVKRWDQTVTQIDAGVTRWPFPRLEDFSVEDMRLMLKLPLQTVELRGTMKSLRPDKKQLVLLLPFDTQEESYTAQGKLEMKVEAGRVTMLDVNLDEGSYQDDNLSLKRLSGWFNANLASGPSQIQAQFMAGAVRYGGQPYADGMAQYSVDGAADTAQWTVTLNRATENYFNTWVIKPVPGNRFVVQAATQAGRKNKQAVLISGAPLRLEPLLVPDVQQAR